MASIDTIHRNGNRIAFTVGGEGPLVLLIQGLGMSSKAWLSSSAALEERGFRVASVDNRGTGFSEKPLPPYSMREMAADAACVITHLGGPAIVVGISLGGMIAQHLAIDYPDLVCGLVLAATTVGNPFGKLPKPSVLRALVFGLLGHRKSKDDMRALLVHPATLRRDPTLFHEFERVAGSDESGWRAVAGQFSAACAHNTYFAARRIRVPVEVIAGDSDLILPTANALLLARRIGGAALTILPQAGHVFPLEYPHAIPDAIDRVRSRLCEAPGFSVHQD
ncbi:MAG: alpha/beta hydrolase [Polyangiaceae bacterium]|nr:alpha/beta hydrolase [Polyangiaceae bacterium]